jgi:polysaccharide biosynthesis transport protein
MSLLQLLQIVYARKRITALIWSVTLAVALAINLILPRIYSANATLVIDTAVKDVVTGMTLPAQEAPGYLATQSEIIRSENVSLKVVDKLNLTQAPALRELFAQEPGASDDLRHWAALRLLKDLDVSAGRDSSLINVSFSNPARNWVAKVANGFAEAYMGTVLALKIEPARKAADWFDEQTRSLRARLEQAQARLSAYQEKNGIVATDERFDPDTSQLAEVSTQLMQAQSQTYETVSRRKQINDAASGNRSTALPDIMANVTVQALKAELARAENKVLELSQRVGAKHPQYVRAVAEVETIKTRLSSEIDTANAGVVNSNEIAQRREAQLRSALEQQKARVLRLKQQRDEVGVLARDVEVARHDYEMAMARATQTRLESQANLTNVALLNPAIEPNKPSRPKELLNLAVALVIATFLALGAALALEILDRRVRSGYDLSEQLGIPLMGEIERGRRPSRVRLLPLRRELPAPSTPGVQG